MSAVLAASAWPSNADLIVDCAKLDYLRPEWRTLDPTFGRGQWWEKWRPDDLVTHDLRSDGVDFLDLPYCDDEFDAAVFDPPYMAPGGRDKSTIPDFNDRFGLHTTPRRPESLQFELINPGLAEVCRVVKPKALVLVKCMDYINGGALWPGTHHTLTHALSLGCSLVDRLEHFRNKPPLGGWVTQVHARRNLSTLFVLRTERAS